MSKENKPLIYAYIRRGWYHQVISTCDSIMQKKGKDPISVYWKAFALGMTNNLPECLRQLESFQSRRDMQFPASLAALHFHKKASVIDYEAVESLRSEISIAEDVAKDAGVLLAARFSLFIGDFSTAARLSKKVLGSTTNPSTPAELEALAIDYWISINEVMLMSSAPSDYDMQKLRTIDNYMRNNSDLSDLELLMVWAKAQQLSGNYNEALNVLNKVIAMYPWFLPGLSEKALILSSLTHWDQALDTAQRTLDTDAQYLDALKILVVHAFIKESHTDEALQKFEDYITALNAREPSSPPIYYETAQLVARICNRQPRALQLCTQLLEQVLPANPAASDARFFSELGYIQTLRGQYDNAIRLYRDASKYDNMSFVALEGMIFCQLLDKQTDSAEAQIELLSMMHSSDDDISAEFCYLQALLAMQRQHDMSAHLNKLNECKTKYFHRFTDTLKHHTEPLHELILMNIDFLLQLAISYLQHMESTTVIADLSSPTSAKAVSAGIEILEQILKVAPGISGIYVELARVYAGLNKHDEACKYLRQSLSLLPSYAPAFIMLAKVECSRNNTQAAQRALEQALSCDFSIRSVPLFRLVSTMVKAQQTKYDEAIPEIEAIMKAPEFKVDSRMSLDTMRLTDDDVVQAYILHATMLGKNGRLKESRKVLAAAKIQFAGTAQEVQVLIASSQLAVERNDYDTAIRMLDKISPSGSSSTYVKAQLIKADILLNHCRDKEGYTKCYQNLVDIDNETGGNSGKSYALLGDAYIKILNPEAAVSAYEKAYKYDPYNISLRIKIGKALTATHEYHRAIDFYEASLRELSQAQLPSPTLSYTVPISHDLCRIYLKLGRLEAAGRVLQQALHTEFTDISDMIDNVETLKMLYTVEVENMPETAIETLEKAKNLQRDVVSTVKSSSMSTLDSVAKQREKLSEIFCMLASAYSEHHGSDGMDGDTIEKYLTESLQHNPQNIKAMYQLARVRYSRNENEKCIIQCNKILTVAPDNEQAAIMLADVLAKDEKASEGPCLMPLKRLLERFPNNYLALERLLYHLRRLGMLDEAPKYIEYAEKNDCRYNAHAGYHFCKGLYSRYTNDVNKAILEFNYTRVDNGHWGTEGLAHMIELYLNPDQEGAWEEKEGESEMTNAGSENVKAAMALLQDLKPRAKDHKRVMVLENYVLLATKQKSNIDKAMQSFIEMLEEDGDYLPAVLGMATGFMIEKTQHKARNLLKRVAKMEMKDQDGEDFEKSNLLLAKFYVDKTKYDLAQDLCKRCLAQNKSCSQAWEIMGLVMEKEMDYRNAADCYQKAWKLEFEASATVGFKLAFNYLKSNMNVEAIEVCEQVLALYPDYPRIRSEILMRAQASIRP